MDIYLVEAIINGVLLGGVLALLARAADLPDFPALQAHVVETQRQVRESFARILGKAR